MNCSFNSTLEREPSLSNAAKTMADRAMPLGNALSLRDGLKTVRDVVSALMCQPRFFGDDGLPNMAGDELSGICDALEARLDDLVSVIRVSHPSHDFYRRQRAAFLAAHEIEEDGNAADALIAPFLTSQS